MSPPAGKNYDSSVASTHGVVLSSAYCPNCAKEDGVKLNIWDFAGRTFIWAPVHFSWRATRSSWASATENQQEHEYDGITFRNYPLAYWVNVRHLGGENSCAAIVQTRCDRPADSAICPVSEGELRDTLGSYYFLVNYSADFGRASLNDLAVPSKRVKNTH